MYPRSLTVDIPDSNCHSRISRRCRRRQISGSKIRAGRNVQSVDQNYNSTDLHHNGNGSDEANSVKTYDLVTLSNLCVDVIVPCDSLPSDDEDDRKALLKYLAENPPSISSWEVGGNTNTLIAASRLGMTVGSVGQVGRDRFGYFMQDVLSKEGVFMASGIVEEDSELAKGFETLVCFVLVDKESGEHSFCSRYDFGPWPLFQSVTTLSESVKKVLARSRSIFVNGFVFDEMPESLVVSAARYAQKHGASVLFDPGPRSWTFCEGDRRHALESMLDVADVVLMTEEEAAVVVGTDDAVAAAERLMARPNSRAQWVVIKRGAKGAVLGEKRTGTLHFQDGYTVDVKDTVGCGDSFAAAIALGCTHTKDVVATLALAGAVGAATAMGTGAGRNVATIDKVSTILKTNASSTPREVTDAAWNIVLEACSISDEASNPSV
jgi:sugar/nucleoside kinase (ribokinase family)